MRLRTTLLIGLFAATLIAACTSAGDHSACPCDAGTGGGAGGQSAPDAGIHHDAGHGGEGGGKGGGGELPDGGAPDADGGSTDGGDSDAGPLPLQGNVIHVAGFDEPSIVAAIAAAVPGDTVFFPAGTYEITSTLALKGGLLYHGEPGAILHNAAGTTTARASGAEVTGISIDGLTFDGGNLVLSGDTTSFSHDVTVVHCTFENIVLSTNFGEMQGVLIDHLEHSRFDYNTFKDNGVMGEAYALIAYTTNDSSFSHNLLTHTYQGFHFESADTTGGNGLDVSYNTADSLLAIGIEFNKNASNAVVEHNHLSNWRSGNANGMALSIVPTGSNNSIRHNYASGAGCATCNIGIEANGTNSFYQSNTVDGFYTNVAISCAPGTIFSKNTLTNAGMWGTFDKDGGYCGTEIIGENTINGVVTDGYTFPP